MVFLLIIKETNISHLGEFKSENKVNLFDENYYFKTNIPTGGEVEDTSNAWRVLVSSSYKKQLVLILNLILFIIIILHLLQLNIDIMLALVINIIKLKQLNQYFI